MIRLWNRVGLYRTLAVLLLIGAVAGGVAVAADRPADQPAAANAGDAVDTEDVANNEPIDRDALARQDAERAEAERAARAAAQRKANEAAVAAAEQAKSASPSASAGAAGGNKSSFTPPPAPASCNVYTGNKRTGCGMVLAKGWDLTQMGCLEKLWDKESHWNHNARNRSSGAYGIPQSLPESNLGKEEQGGADDYRTNPATQINWGLTYIGKRYKTPCNAWNHSINTGWY